MSRSAASTAAFAMKLLTLLRSAAAARSTMSRSSSVRYTKVFRPNGCRDRRRDFGEGGPFMESIVHRRENVVLKLLWVLQGKPNQDHRLSDANKLQNWKGSQRL